MEVPPPEVLLVLCELPGPPLMMVLLPSGPMMVPELTAAPAQRSQPSHAARFKTSHHFIFHFCTVVEHMDGARM